jgi:hypothetical protein
MARLRTLAPLLWLVFGCAAAWGHSMLQTAVLLDFRGNTVEAELQLPVDRLAITFQPQVTAENLTQVRPALSAYIAEHIHPVTPAGRPFSVSVDRISLERVEGAPYVIAHTTLRPPAGAETRRFTLNYDLIVHQLLTHVVLVSVRSDWQSATFASAPHVIGVIRYMRKSVEIDRTNGSWFAGFQSIFGLGMRHIAEGTDHLLFLLVLLLPAPLLARRRRRTGTWYWSRFGDARHGLRQILRVVTAFTVGHSITLALGAMGVVQVLSRPVEILIAISILVSAVHAVRPIFAQREWMIAGGFGLVHGLAFASTLAELGLGRWERVASILSFNLGIEGMQLIVVAATIPSLVLLSWTPIYGGIRIAGAVLAGTAAVGWVVERSLNLSLRLTVLVERIAHHAILLGCGLALLAVLATICFGWRREGAVRSVPADAP